MNTKLVSCDIKSYLRMTPEFGQQFERLIGKLLISLGYQVKYNQRITYDNTHYEIDIIAGDQDSLFIETKFYRSQQVPPTLIEDVVKTLVFKINAGQAANGVFATSSYVSDEQKAFIKNKYGVLVWDRKILTNAMGRVSATVKQEFEQLLLKAQQGTETFFETEKTSVDLNQALKDLPLAKTIGVAKPNRPGEALKEELRALNKGRDQWVAYERLMTRILKHLFDGDLTGWDPQRTTDDDLSRFDLVCRVNGFDSFWKAVIRSFNTRFILFEFKNYTAKITQNQVYMTERYLYNRALRSVAFIISRLGPNDGAQEAAKGALKENGKLMLFLTDEDIYKMLDIKDSKGGPSDHLSGLLDNWLMGLSR